MSSTRLQIIALRSVKHSDRANILTAYSLQAGRLSFAVPAGPTREAARRRALLMPMSLVECSADLRKRAGILTMTDVRPAIPLQELYSNPVKVMIASFIADTLCSALRESQSDPVMFAFLADTAKALNDAPADAVANFHIAFLVQLARFLGIAPDYQSYTPGSVLSCAEGVFRASAPTAPGAVWLTPEQSAFARQLGRINYRNMRLFKLGRSERAYVTDRILAYFTLHHAPMTSLASLQILRSF